MVDRGYNHPATIIDLYEQEVGVVVRLLPTAQLSHKKFIDVL
jgi:hypothetical protein